MENNQRNSRKRLNSLILLVAFTAVMLIVSTYAWFSTQRNVTLTGLKGKVNVAEGLQISLDAKHWVNTINFNDFVQTDPASWTVSSTSSTTYLDPGMTFQSPAGETGGITNIVPTEYLPVSTTGAQDEGIGTTGLVMYNGNYTDSAGLKDIAIASELPASGYFAFDLYFMNTSKTGITSDKLLLDINSDVTGVNEATGIQNTVRVGIALYENAGESMKIGQSTEPTQAQIITGTSTGKNITDVAIWEPNCEEHVDTIVNSVGDKLKLLDTVGGASGFGLTKVADVVTGTSSRYSFTNGKALPTYALTAASQTAGTIADVYDWATPAAGLTRQNTTQTTTAARDASIELMSVTNGTTPIEIIANQYQKARVYVWIEGQDPDCINYASLGGGLTLNLGLSKPENPNS